VSVSADDLEALATQPASASGDAGSVTSRPAADVVALAGVAAATRAAGNAARGLRFTKLTMGGQVSGVPGSPRGFDRLC
jgi:hypothetical protein